MKKRIITIFLLTAFLFSSSLLTSCQKEKEKFSSYSFDYFDTVTSITGYEETKEDFDKISQEILDELRIYHKLFTIYDRYEDINNLCTVNTVYNGEHRVVEVDQKIIDMLLFCKDMYQKTDGKVNVAMGSVLSIWHEYRSRGIDDPSSAQLPPKKDLEEAAKHTDISKLIIDDENNTVFLSDPEMLLDVGAIAKGYAVEMIAQSLYEKGISGYVLNVGGNVRTIGVRGDGSKWKAGVDDPNGTDNAPYYATVELQDLSLVTSGSYQRYYIVDGKNYNHIINPDTLMPADIYTSVSIICESSALADALSTALFSMSIADGKALINEIENVEAMWVSNDGAITFSEGFQKYTY